MKYNFPHITHLDQVREAIKGRSEFVVAERDWGFVVNYLVGFEDTFNDPQKINGALRRECRGLKFDLMGNVLARPYHKFFNLNERHETRAENVDFSQDFVILEKLDGSMIHPIYLGGNWNLSPENLIWCTKMGPTDIAVPVQKFVEKNEQYARYAAHVMANNRTPIFEWCSRVQRIVVDYPEDMLILTAIRDNTTGQYLPYEELVKAETHDIRVVKAWQGDFSGIQDFVDTVQHLEGEEGYIIRFANGHMLKIKNLWYVQLHKAKELMQNEKDVWAVVLDDRVDDVKAFQEEADQKRLNDFQEALIHALDQTSDRLNWEVIAWRDNNGESKKKFAVEFVNAEKRFSSKEKAILFKIWDGNDSKEVVYETVRQSLGSFSKLEDVRHLANGIEWKDF